MRTRRLGDAQLPVSPLCVQNSGDGADGRAVACDGMGPAVHITEAQSEPRIACYRCGASHHMTVGLASREGRPHLVFSHPTN